MAMKLIYATAKVIAAVWRELFLALLDAGVGRLASKHQSSASFAWVTVKNIHDSEERVHGY